MMYILLTERNNTVYIPGGKMKEMIRSDKYNKLGSKSSQDGGVQMVFEIQWYGPPWPLN